MKHKNALTELILQTVDVTRGRIAKREVFRDLIASCALRISVTTDPVHSDRAQYLNNVIRRRFPHG